MLDWGWKSHFHCLNDCWQEVYIPCCGGKGLSIGFLQNTHNMALVSPKAGSSPRERTKRGHNAFYDLILEV